MTVTTRPRLSGRAYENKSAPSLASILRLQRGDDAEILQSRRVTLHFATTRNFFQDTPHDLSAARLRQARREAHGIGFRDGSDFLADVVAEFFLQRLAQVIPDFTVTKTTRA